MEVQEVGYVDVRIVEQGLRLRGYKRRANQVDCLAFRLRFTVLWLRA